jgi:transposase
VALAIRGTGHQFLCGCGRGGQKTRVRHHARMRSPMRWKACRVAERLAGMERQALHDAAHQPRPGVPPSVTLLRMPPYSPELNPVERVWLYLRERHLFHRLHDRYTAVVDASSNRLGCITAR